MGRGDGGAERAGRSVADFLDGINSALRTWWNFTVAVEFDVRCQVVGIVDGFTIGFAFLQSELLDCNVNLTQVVDARIESSCASRAYKIWNDGSQDKNSDNKTNDHPHNPFRYR